jgi:D-arabinose 1-dehydrogenase-like Zn-dependent alcohol dehydrogenase
MGTQQDLAEMMAFMSENDVRPVIDRVLPMAQAAEAFAAMHAGDVHGKLVLTR